MTKTNSNKANKFMKLASGLTSTIKDVWENVLTNLGIT